MGAGFFLGLRLGCLLFSQGFGFLRLSLLGCRSGSLLLAFGFFGCGLLACFLLGLLARFGRRFTLGSRLALGLIVNHHHRRRRGFGRFGGFQRFARCRFGRFNRFGGFRRPHFRGACFCCTWGSAAGQRIGQFGAGAGVGIRVGVGLGCRLEHGRRCQIGSVIGRCGFVIHHDLRRFNRSGNHFRRAGRGRGFFTRALVEHFGQQDAGQHHHGRCAHEAAAVFAFELFVFVKRIQAWVCH